MKRQTFFSTNFLGALLMLALTASVLGSCKKEEEPDTDSVIASFQYEVSMDNFLEVTFSNFSQNATSYDWDFGDGNTSTAEDPTHVYAQAGTYTVTLTATGDDGKSSTKKETINLEDPNTLLTLLAGDDKKTWYLQREGIALGIGPALDDNQFWSFGGVTPLGDRPCVLDDSYTFYRDGTWELESNGTIFVDAQANGGWLGTTEGCYDESEPGVFTAFTGEDVSAFANGGNYTYEFNTSDGTITLLGDGAYIGLANKTETGDNYIPVGTKTYTVFNFVDGDIADSLQMGIVGNGFAWNFYLVSYEDINDLPEIPTAQPAANFTFNTDQLTVTFTNGSSNSTSYMWDFGDGVTSTEENPVHTYADEGTYTVTLTAMDGMGQSDEVSQDVSVSLAQFTAAALSDADGKTWVLDGENSFYVGSGAGLNDYWPGLDAAGVVTQVCRMNDEFTFFDNGDFVHDAKGDIWFEDYLGGPNACEDEANIPAPYNVLGSGTFAFSATDEAVTVNGTGAYIGFDKAINGGELNAGTGIGPAATITYQVFDYVKVGNDETLFITIEIGGGTHWTMRMKALN